MAVPAKPYKDPDNYIHISRRLAEEMNAQSPALLSGPISLTTPITARAIMKQQALKFGQYGRQS